MSGIGGVFALDGDPADRGDLENMAAMLERRGPDRSGVWHNGSTGLVHAALVATPEGARERLPLTYAGGSLTITADARLDNREELIGLLGVEKGREVGDAGLILRAYRKWGEECPERLLGDFSFALWDAPHKTLFCARDHFGVRPFYYYHAPGRLFLFGSEPGAVLALETVPYRINEPRITDFLVTQLEGIDKTSTFFEGVFRLPPGHNLTVTGDGIRLRRYWSLEPGPKLRLSSEDEYEEGFLEVFTEAVRCRLRGDSGSVGVLLSGGMDSGTVAAVAKDLLRESGTGPLPTFSGVGPDPGTCVETRAIHSILGTSGLDRHLVSNQGLQEILSELEALAWQTAEPFDHANTMLWALYLSASRHGTRVLLDGIDGDTVFSEGNYLAHLIRRGKLRKAYREAKGRSRFLGGGPSPWRTLLVRTAQAFTPPFLWPFRRGMPARFRRKRLEDIYRRSLINRTFARRVDLGGRLDALDAHRSPGPMMDLPQDRAEAIMHPYLTVGLERYQRTASSLGLESRHPFVDLRVVDYCVSLPGSQKLDRGWPKPILRRAMSGRLPDDVRWRTGKEHLGWSFTESLMKIMGSRLDGVIEKNLDLLAEYVDIDKLNEARRTYFDRGNAAHADWLYEAAHLGEWLRRHEERFKPGGSSEAPLQETPSD